MQIIKITSFGCTSCIIMNERLEEVTKKYKIDVINYNYDFDDVDIFNPGSILPVIIIKSGGKEISRLVGEHSKNEIINEIEEVLKYEK